MLHVAHASAHHWRTEGSGASANNLARSEWLVSRVYTVLCRAASVSGDLSAARQWAEQARQVPIADAEDRALLLSDLATIPGIEVTD